MKLRRPLAAALSVGLITFLGACADDELADDDGNGGGGGETGGQVTLASQSFDEAALVTAMYEALLQDNGYEVEKQLVDTRDIYMQEFPGNVDIVPEYVAGIGDFLNTQTSGEGAAPVTTNDTEESIEAITPLADAQGITLLDPSPATSQNAFFVTQEFSDSEGVTALSDLEGMSVKLAAAPDCEGRDDCEKGLTQVYGINISELLPLGFASPETYQSVLEGEAQLGQTGTLDGTLESQGLVLLEDDRGIQPAQNLIPAVSSDFLAEHEDVEPLLNDLMAVLDNEVMGELLVRVTVDRETPEDVATSFLEDEGLL
ncbi:MAG: amino acid ABC transporter substrate-binding protein [Actinomycetota bacterium]|nr:amino acid ABC transporter substrate-binding protein [Actinomycetota bacterium]